MKPQLKEFILKSNKKLVILTGAGLSTESGIPDYRGPNGIYTRNPHYKPITYQQFIKSHAFRQRYWARSCLGWPRIANALPNETHVHLQKMESHGYCLPIITQNVDGLHVKAGSSHVLEMHGSLENVKCTHCHYTLPREDIQNRLVKENAQWILNSPKQIQGDVASSVNPDGDVEVHWDYSQFKYPSCDQCGSILKPDVVFFGENMSSKVRDDGFQRIQDANSLLVIGSSLSVYSAYRLVLFAKEKGKRIGILNLGPTRGDELTLDVFRSHCSLIHSIELE